MSQRIGWPTSVVALGFLALLGVMFWRATDNIDNFDRIWTVAGPILGVAVGAIPALFFAQGARRDQRDASRRAEAYAAVMPEGLVPAALDALERTGDIGQK